MKTLLGVFLILYPFVGGTIMIFGWEGILILLTVGLMVASVVTGFLLLMGEI